MKVSRIIQIFGLILFIQIISFQDLCAQSIRIIEDPSIQELMEKYKMWEEEENKIPGWRIQIINTDDRRKMEKALSEFRYHFPEVGYSNWKQVSPYYKVIIGAYASKLEVLAFLQEVKEHFPSAIPVIEKINKKELLNL